MPPGSISGLAFVGAIVSCRKLAGFVDEPRGAWLGWDRMGSGDPEPDRGAGQNDMRLARRGNNASAEPTAANANRDANSASPRGALTRRKVSRR